MDRKIRVVFGNMWYPVSMGMYFHRAFQRRSDVELFTYGPFTGDYIPWMFGMRLPQKYVYTPDLPFPQSTCNKYGVIPSGLVEAQLPWKNPDLWVQVDGGFHLANRPKADKVVHIQTDPHVLKGIYQFPKSYSDISYSMQEFYMEAGEKYLPYAYDPTVHYREELPIQYDACLIGLQYPQRNSLVNLLRGMGLSVYFDTGKVYDEYRQIYSSSKIALNWSTLQDMPARFWEALGMGLPLVSNNLPDAKNFFVEGEDYLGFDDLQQAGRQVMSLIADPEKAKKIAESGWNKIRPHTYDARVEQILKDVELL